MSFFKEEGYELLQRSYVVLVKIIGDLASIVNELESLCLKVFIGMQNR